MGRRPTTTASFMKTATRLSTALPAPAGLKTVPWGSVMGKMRMAHGDMEPSVLLNGITVTHPPWITSGTSLDDSIFIIFHISTELQHLCLHLQFFFIDVIS